MTTTEEKPSLQGTWNIDPVHSELAFKARHMAVGKAGGTIGVKSGVLTFPDEKFENGAVVVELDTTTVETKNETRNNHVKSDDFLNVEKYPLITFVSTGVKDFDGENFILEGNLTIREITKSVSLNAELLGTIVDANGQSRIGVEATTTINRKDWDVKFSPVFGVSNAVVSDKIQLSIEAEFIKD